MYLDPDSSGSRESLASEASQSGVKTTTLNSFDTPHSSTQNPTNETMPLTTIECLKLAGGQISKPYAGDALALQPFINSIKLIKTVAGDDHADLIKTFVLSKLEGRR